MSAPSIVMGRQDYPSVVLRLVGMELYKLRRRTLSRVVGSIAVTLAILLFLLISVATIFTSNAPASSFIQTCQSQTAPGSQPASGPAANCATPPPAVVAQDRHAALQETSAPLRLPDSLNVAVQFALIAGTILIIILVGTIAGGEYSIGTVRLMYTRGPTRTQFLIARLLAAFIIIALGMLLMTILGILSGQLLNPLSGITQNGDFWSTGWAGHALLYLFIGMINWFMYAAIAIFFGTLGRSTAAGIVGALTWFFVEPVLGSLLGFLGGFTPGPFGDFLKAIPDYFIGNNFSALLSDQGQYLFGGSTTSTPAISVMHAVLVLLVYFAFFIGLTWWINERRDVTN
ncbi:MAG TPA: ABC transporter permease [Ktedonobacteraceae bacterium]|nr:ABC transporter permease [Ktedonobacteraceae bacterium]